MCVFSSSTNPPGSQGEEGGVWQPDFTGVQRHWKSNPHHHLAGEWEYCEYSVFVCLKTCLGVWWVS